MKKSKPMKKCDVRLTDAEIKLASKLGGGSISRGIRLAISGELGEAISVKFNDVSVRVSYPNGRTTVFFETPFPYSATQKLQAMLKAAKAAVKHQAEADAR